jgi:hypothetical protein
MNRPSERLGISGTLKNATKSSATKITFTNADLPIACLPLWNERYIPRIVDFAGTISNPWVCHDTNILGNLQTIWEQTYPDIAVDIQPKQSIFVRVCVFFEVFSALL